MAPECCGCCLYRQSQGFRIIQHDHNLSRGDLPSSGRKEYILDQNYPNPVTRQTTIRYSTPVEGLVSLIIYDLEGKTVATLVNEVQPAGIYKVSLERTTLPGGVYSYMLQAGNISITRKLIIITN